MTEKKHPQVKQTITSLAEVKKIVIPQITML